VSVPMNPMVDGWMGDDWFHNGAFRQQNLPYIYDQQATRDNQAKWWSGHLDDYDLYMEAGSAGELGQRHGMEQIGFWRKLLAHPSYDAFWREQAMDRVLGAQPLKVPVMLVDSLWDQEDIYGAIAVYKAIKPKDTSNDKVFLVMGPWFHSQVNREGWSLGPFKWDGDTALQFRREMVLPFFNQYLKGGPPANLARATIYNPAENRWQHFKDWPTACAKGCAHPLTPLYLQAGFGLGFGKPSGEGDSYVSDPAKPVPYLPRPVRFSDSDQWRTWLVRDQRFVDGRPDVLMYETAPLTAPVKIEGAPIADIVASTTGTDGDFVVRLIDVYPSVYPSQPELGGYELPVGTDIFRGRYRESFEHPSAIPANTPQHYRFALPHQNYVFLPGHRIMVQIQSSLFPLYDRNPQTYVDNILFAKSSDYKKATITVLHAGDNASAVWLPVVK